MTLTNSYVIGGYNDSSWYSTGSFWKLKNASESKSFIFNLTGGFKAERSRFEWDTGNFSSYGPTFGGGHDLY